MVENYRTTRVELILCARNLVNRDAFSKSDPFVNVSLVTKNNTHQLLGKTEVIRDNLNPNWKSTITIDYIFETKQVLHFHVLDYDDTAPDVLGEATVTLGELVSKGTQILNLAPKGTLVARVEELKSCTDSFQLWIRGLHLDKKDTFGKSDPYLIFYRNISGTWSEAYRTDVIKNTLDPIWNPITLDAQKVANGDLEKTIKVDCFDWDRVGSHDLIGSSEVTLYQLGQKGFSFPLYETVANQKKNKNSGIIEINDVVHIRNLSFIDYLRAGVQISFSIAIDFTASNGEYSQPSSLHYYTQTHLNQYQKAIYEIGGILEAYDSDKSFPVFGFGGIPHGETKTNHCFPLTFTENPYVHGINGVMAAYQQALCNVALNGPTLFHHVIDAAISETERTGPTAQYNVLMILTDGAIMDMQETISSIVRGSRLPLSIIIVGVGTADFSSMVALDCDGGRLRNARGESAVRDTVQFVPFYKFSGDPVALAAEVLREVPGQLTEYMKMIGYVPDIPQQQNLHNVLASAPEFE